MTSKEHPTATITTPNSTPGQSGRFGSERVADFRRNQWPLSSECAPWENGYNESFNSKLRDEILNTEIFSTLKEAKVLIEGWQHHYNTIRPHSSLGYRPPTAETILPNVEGLTYAVDGLRLAHQLNPRQTLT